MHYSIGKRRDQWVVSIDGKAIMGCKHRKMAVQIAKQATVTLTEWHNDMDREVIAVQGFVVSTEVGAVRPV
jgi:hypothetical protein